MSEERTNGDVLHRLVRISRAQFAELAALLAVIYAQPINPIVLDAVIKARFLIRAISYANK
jgi:hypothetical protein